MLAAQIKHAFKVNLLPAISLQMLAFAIAYSYFYWPAAQPLFQAVEALKLQYGTYFAIYSTAIFGGAIPYCYLLLSGKIKAQPWQQAIFYCLLWAFLGFVVDSFYSIQAVWFGNDNDFTTIAKKTFVDQFLWSALVTCPFMTVMFLWKDQGFNVRKLGQQLNKQLFTLRIPSIVISNWLVWIPAVSIIYAMPSALQLPLFNVVLCFFVLVLAVLTDNN